VLDKIIKIAIKCKPACMMIGSGSVSNFLAGSTFSRGLQVRPALESLRARFRVRIPSLMRDRAKKGAILAIGCIRRRLRRLTGDLIVSDRA
jgi:hypothetical protein